MCSILYQYIYSYPPIQKRLMAGRGLLHQLSKQDGHSWKIIFPKHYNFFLSLPAVTQSEVMVSDTHFDKGMFRHVLSDRTKHDGLLEVGDMLELFSAIANNNRSHLICPHKVPSMMRWNNNKQNWLIIFELKHHGCQKWNSRTGKQIFPKQGHHISDDSHCRYDLLTFDIDWPWHSIGLMTGCSTRHQRNFLDSQ